MRNRNKYDQENNDQREQTHSSKNQTKQKRKTLIGYNYEQNLFFTYKIQLNVINGTFTGDNKMSRGYGKYSVKEDKFRNYSLNLCIQM